MGQEGPRPSRSTPGPEQALTRSKGRRTDPRHGCETTSGDDAAVDPRDATRGAPDLGCCPRAASPAVQRRRRPRRLNFGANAAVADKTALRIQHGFATDPKLLQHTAFEDTAEGEEGIRPIAARPKVDLRQRGFAGQKVRLSAMCAGQRCSPAEAATLARTFSSAPDSLALSPSRRSPMG